MQSNKNIFNAKYDYVHDGPILIEYTNLEGQPPSYNLSPNILDKISNEYPFYSKYYTNSYNNEKSNKYYKSNEENKQDNKLVIRHELVFLMDHTGSTSDIFEGMIQEIEKTVSTIKSQCQKSIEETMLEENIKDKELKSEDIILELRYAIIMYRDFWDREQFIVHDFTTNLEEFKEFIIKTCKPSGGNDQPEDIFGAFLTALNGIDNKVPELSWLPNDKIASRNMILITDAPSHGNLFTISKNIFMNDDMKMTTEEHSQYYKEWIKLFSELKTKDITLYLVKVTNNICSTFDVLQKFADDVKIQVYISDATQFINPKQTSGLYGLRDLEKISRFDSSSTFTSLATNLARTSSSNSHNFIINNLSKTT
jgi:hypothetical protein